MHAAMWSFEEPAPGGSDRQVTRFRLVLGDGSVHESSSAVQLAGVLLDRVLAAEVGSRDDVLPALRQELSVAAERLAAVLAARGAR